MMTATTPRVWIGCLACYNNGRLVGEWFDALTAGDVSTDQVHDAAGFEASTWDYEQHEELWVMDHEGFEGLLTGECSPTEAQEKAELLESVPEDDRPALAAFVSNGYASEDFEDAYCGEWGSMESYADELLEDTGMLDQLPEWAQPYFDTEKYARDLELSGDYWTADAHPGVYVFRSI